MLFHYLAGTSLATYAYAFAHSTGSNAHLDARLFPVCMQIQSETSSATSVFYPGDPNYVIDITHWASSSTQLAQCSVEPGTAQDVAIILQIIGSTRTPFAVEGGGHTANPGFSSTTGVHISMRRFSEITFDAGSQTVVLGAGLVWDDVYAVLPPQGVNVVGGRFSGVGVAGFMLGGGYSWLTNQYGLAIDNVVAFELVKPNGDIVSVTATSDATLFWGLKGGLNNFGIVTRFTLKTFPQGLVWGGFLAYTPDHADEFAAATVKFTNTVTDPKAGIMPTYSQTLLALLMFYDGPVPPPGIFDDFMAIPHLAPDVSTRDFLSLIRSTPTNATTGQRDIFDTVSLTAYTPNVLNAIRNETLFWGARLGLGSGVFLIYYLEPFLPTLFSHGADSAYPPSRAQYLSPLWLWFSWLLPTSDDDFHQAIKQSAAQIKAVAIAEGQNISDAALYPNYAIFDTPLGAMYGSNVPTLQALKASVDPTNVMGLAGGFKF